ncbi:hypothetical protein B0H13DRAFT_1880833 [Mycena leptocephala]|nr:hypothetical protein B0H13DRAFT_1880833 [Mycena leptocephala]
MDFVCLKFNALHLASYYSLMKLELEVGLPRRIVALTCVGSSRQRSDPSPRSCTGSAAVKTRKPSPSIGSWLNISKRKRVLLSRIIPPEGTNAMRFANRRDEGPSHPEIFNPLPEEALVAVLTATENTIDEYLAGIRTDVPFTANEYYSVYETHLKSLRQFRQHTIKYELLDKILTRIRLHNIGW